MFQQLFGVMNDLLDDIMLRYPHSNSEERTEMLEQLAQLRRISDVFIEEWVTLEEKLADFRDLFPAEAAEAGIPEISLESIGKPSSVENRLAGMKEQTAAASQPQHPFPQAKAKPPQAAEKFSMDVSGDTVERIARGQGYFKLFMFPQAAVHFREAVEHSPECDLARMYLAMSLMHMQQWTDAELHFKLLVSLTDHPRWQAIGFNALGCIQAVRLNIDNAERLFHQAHKIDPSFEDPLTNLKSCRQTPGPLSLYFGSAELTCL